MVKSDSNQRATLARALSKLGVMSRTQARLAIAAGRVRVDGRPVRDPDFWVDLASQRIEFDGVVAVAQPKVYVRFHKPVGVVTTRADELGRSTVYDVGPDFLAGLSPVGRLDLDSSGLLLFTNDTLFADGISGPASGVAKVYEVDFDGPLSAPSVERMRRGMTLPNGDALRPVDVRWIDPSDRTRATLTLREGKNRQIRRMAEDCGLTVIRLHRIAIGPVRLGDLVAGAAVKLDDDELEGLRFARNARIRHK